MLVVNARLGVPHGAHAGKKVKRERERIHDSVQLKMSNENIHNFQYLDCPVYVLLLQAETWPLWQGHLLEQENHWA